MIQVVDLAEGGTTIELANAVNGSSPNQVGGNGRLDQLPESNTIIGERSNEIEREEPAGELAPVKTPEMVWIGGGSFLMGTDESEILGQQVHRRSDRESPRVLDNELAKLGGLSANPIHRVAVPSFFMSKYEVTFDEYDQFTDETGRDRLDDFGWGRGQRPVPNITFDSGS